MMMMILLFLLGRECLRDKESTGSRQREHNALAGNVGQKQKYTNTNTQRQRIIRRQCRTKKKTSIGNTIQKTCVTKYVDTVLEHFDEGLFCEYFENTAKIVVGRIDAFHRSQSIPTLNLSKFHYKPPSAPKLNIPKYSTFENRHAWSILILQNQTCLNSGNLVI